MAVTYDPPLLEGLDADPPSKADIRGWFAQIRNASADEEAARTSADAGLSQRLYQEVADRSAAIRDAGVIPTQKVAGTANAITAELVASAPDQLSASATVELIPAAANTGPVTLALPGYGPWPIYRRAGGALVAGDLAPGASYLLRRRSDTWRIVGMVDGEVSAQVAGEAALRLDGTRTAGVLPTVSVAGTADAITASLDPLAGAGITLGPRSTITLVPAADNTAPGVTLSVDGMGAWPVTRRDGSALQPGDLKAGVSARLVRRGSAWRLDLAAPSETREVVDTLTAELRNILPGDSVVLVDAANGPAVVVDGTTGELKARLRSEYLTWGGIDLKAPILPGDFIAPVVADAAGTTVFGIDIRDGSPYPKQASVTDSAGELTVPVRSERLIWGGVDLTPPLFPGDWIAPVVADARGTTLAGIDIRDGSLYPAPPPAPNTAVSFVDPFNLGHAWMAIQTPDGVIRYMSDQWRGRVIGFEKRGDVTLAQTPDPAVGVVHFGGTSHGVARPIAEDYPFHVVDETLLAPESRLSASATAVAHLALQDAGRRAMTTMLPIEVPISSTVEADAAPGSPGRTLILTRLAAARAALLTWEKALFVDRLGLSLLEGAPGTSEVSADFHYASVANAMRQEVAAATGQGALPLVVVSQSGGTRTNGTSEVILAEGRLQYKHWSLGFLLAGPCYPYAIQPGTAAALAPEAALQVSEIEALAVIERLAGRDWYPPVIEAATLSGSAIVVRFSTMSQLVLQDAAAHGFTLSGVTNGAAILSAAVTGTNLVTLTLTAAPTGTVMVNYAFGRTTARGGDVFANAGSLTDSYAQPSLQLPGITLRRYALSGRVTLQ